MRKLKLMADYSCFPLWEDGDNSWGNVSPDDLNISDNLKLDLNKWSDEFDATLNIDDPLGLGFKSLEDENEFKLRGKNLLLRLTEELGSDYFVRYQEN